MGERDGSGAFAAAPSYMRVSDLIELARTHDAATLEARLAPLILLGPEPSSDGDWSFRTASLNLLRDNIDGHEVVFDVGFLVHPLKKLKPGPFASTILIGRSGSNDISVLHSSVSKLHARVTVTADGYSVTDADSSNGTVVGTKRLGPRDSAPLAPGVMLTIGACHFTVVDAKRFHQMLLRIR